MEKDTRLNDDNFWALVKHIDWPNNKNIKLTSEQKRFSDIEYTFRKALVYAIEQYSLERYGGKHKWPYCSDDSFWDLTAHIVGLGKDVYIDVLTHPEKVEFYMNEYVENFEYLFN